MIQKNIILKILNNDLDLTNYNSYRIERDNQLAARFKCSTFLNPNNHKITNLKQAESRTFIFETLEDCYMENFIFEDILKIIMLVLLHHL